MTKLSPEALSILDNARREYAPSAADRQRLRERIRERTAASAASATAAGPERMASPTSSVSAARGAAGAVGWARANGAKIAFACVFALVGTSVVARRAFDGPASTENAPNAVDIGSPDERSNSGIALHEVPAAARTADDPHAPVTAEPSVSPHELPDSPPAIEGAKAKSVVAAKSADKRLDRESPRGPRAEAALAGSSNTTPDVGSVDSLGAEMQILRDAHGALKSGDLVHAGSSLEQHARTYPRGVLREERLALTALLLCAEGKTDAARRTARELATENPRSSHLVRLRGSCAVDALDSSK